MGQLTSVAEKMGFTSIDEKLRIEKESTYAGYDLKVKRMSYSQKKTLWESEDGDYVYFTGYIYIKQSDPLFNLETGELDNILDIHGGITYDEIGTTEHGKYRVIGFDTAHYNDYMLVNSSYLEYVRNSHTNVLGTLNLWSDEAVFNQLKRAIDNMEDYKDKEDK